MTDRLRGERALQGLAVLLLLGVAFRVALTAQWRPAFVGYSDSGVYFQGAVEGVWTDPIRTVGYTVVLDVLHAVTPHLTPVIVLQHTLGLAAGVLLYGALRHVGAPGWVALIAAASLLLGGSQVMLEHAALSEGLFTPLMALALYAVVRAPGGTRWWAVLVGVCAGLMIALKGVAIVLVPVVVGCVAFSARRPTRATLAAGGIAAGCALAIVAGYIGVRQQQTDLAGLASNGNWNLYGRVAPFADCTKFTPPPESGPLCDDPLPVGQRPGGEYYIFDSRSPGIRFAGPAYQISPVANAMRTFGRFSRAAILGQPGAYLSAVVNDAVRLVDLDHPSFGQATPRQLQAQFTGGLADGSPTGNGFVEGWRARLYPGDAMTHRSVRAFTTYERWTTPRGPLMVLALLLAAAAPFVAPRGTRNAAALMTLTAFALLFFPIFAKAYDYRFVIPAIGPLTAAACLGAWGTWELGRRRTAGS